MATRGLFVFLAMLVGAGMSTPAGAEEGMQYPIDVAMSDDGIIYVADLKLPGIWRIQDGKLNLYYQGEKKFRTPLNAVRCVAIGPDKMLYAGDSATRDVYRFDENGQPVPLTRGQIGIPSDLLVEQEQVTVSDLELQRIWSLPPSGGDPKEVAVIAGVRGLVRNEAGNLLCVTTLESPLRKIGDDGKIEELLTGQPFQLPHHVCRIGADLYIADNYAKTIWKVHLNGKPAIEAFVSGEPLVGPVGICADGDSLLVADPRAKHIFRISADKKISSVLNDEK